MAVLFDEREGGHEDGVVELDQGFAFEEAVGDGVRLLLVHGEETLVKECLGGEFGVGAEEGVEKGHLRDVAAEDNDADGEWRGEDEAGPSPQECPEDGHGEQGEGGDPVRELNSQGSTKLVAVRPSVRKRPMTKSGGPQEGDDGDGDDKGQHEGGSGADVGDDAKNPGEHPPEGGVGYADEEEAEAEEGSVGCVDSGLKDKVLADAGCGILQGLGHRA